MGAARKISEAEDMISELSGISDNIFRSKFENIIKILNDIFLHLLDEYNVKFGLGIDRITFEKFRSTAKKTGNIKAISFLIWYEKEYKKIKNNEKFGKFLEKDYKMQEGRSSAIKSCHELLDEIKKMSYYAYENF
jgi:hypothetical protein